MRSLLALFLITSSSVLSGQESTNSAQSAVTEAERRRVAVTLNYCRASLSRIRRYPSKRVLIEEQERILNNLDLNAIRDEEVVNLYSAVLDEINQAQILDTERRVISERTRRGMQRKIGADLFVIGAHVATGQLGNAVQSGTNSWWDYRNTAMDRDVQTWALERSRINGIVDRSSRFLDAAWKLSRRNDIPDRWLVRRDDLVRLQTTMQEPNAEVRLRVLNRMSGFMECYPPYWYYVARTQQQLGQLKAAAETYRRLTDLGDGHFRKDDMLASGTANLAMIEEYLSSPTALATAQQALQYSTESWEVNLTCAWVLNRHDKHTDAEDAILRNLDVELEEEQSSIALVSLYYHTKNQEKLAKALSQQQIVSRIPIPGLLLSSTLLAADEFPLAARRRVATSLAAISDTRFGRGDLILRSDPDWKLGDAKITMKIGDQTLEPPRVHTSPLGTEARFVELPSNSPETASSEYVVSLMYPATPEIRLHLTMTKPVLPRQTLPRLEFIRAAEPDDYRISTIEVGTKRLTLEPATLTRQ